MPSLYICLVHYPVKNQKNQIVNTSITNLDIHDIARLCATYDLAGYYIVQPIIKQRELFQELIDYWKCGMGAEYNSSRAKVFHKLKIVDSVERCISDISKDKDTIIIATGANMDNNISFTKLRELIKEKNVVILFGTGWGLADEIVDVSHYKLDSIQGVGEYNHLSVRSAASIIIDRLCCEKWW